MAVARNVQRMSVHVGPNMTPMVDIVMCILIFFMLASSFAIPDLFLTSNTPAISKQGISGETVSAAPAVQNKIELRLIGGQTKVFAFGVMVEDLQGVLPQLLSQKQKELSEDVQILIQPERAVSYQDVITVYNACMQARFKKVAFMSPKS